MLSFLGGAEHKLHTSYIVLGVLLIVVVMMLIVYLVIGGFVGFAPNVILMFMVFLLGGASVYAMKDAMAP